MKPGEGQAGPLMALATALLTTDALPELADGDYPTVANLVDNLRRGGAASVQPIINALTRVAENAHRDRHTDQLPKSAIVLLVDQFEELFAQGVTDGDRAAFAESLRQLVTTRRVWVIATLRADVYELLLKQPALKALKETGASLDLGPPGPVELVEIVRAPAAAAGLVFESDTQKGELGERLLADAKNADSLPILQFTLQQLYERRAEIAGTTRLTHSAYDALGGLDGAIAVEAERAVSGLKPEAVASLPRLLRRLAEPAHDGTKLTLREVSRSEVEADAPEAALLDALIASRILIALTDEQGHPTVRLAHDAVFVSWPRAKDAVQTRSGLLPRAGGSHRRLTALAEIRPPEGPSDPTRCAVSGSRGLSPAFWHRATRRIDRLRHGVAPASAPPPTFPACGGGIFLCAHGCHYGGECMGLPFPERGLCRARPSGANACDDNSNRKHFGVRFGAGVLPPRSAG